MKDFELSTIHISELEEQTTLNDSDVLPLDTSDKKTLKVTAEKIKNYAVEEVNLTKVDRSEKGMANGVASLDENGIIPTAQLPSFVDDILEGTAVNPTQTQAGTYSASGFILTGETEPCVLESGKTYVDTNSNIQYRWTGTGTNLVSMGSGLVLGETQYTAYPGNKGKANAEAIESLQNGKVDKVAGKGLSTEDYTTAEKQKLAEITAADNYAEDSEAYAKGTRGGVPVPSTDDAYNNNSKHYAQDAEQSSVISGSFMRIAGTYADASLDNARKSQSYATGDATDSHGDPYRPGQDVDNAKYYLEQMRQIAPARLLNLLAPIETTSTASINYAVGEQFCYTGILYTATAAINAGDTITPGTNCEASDTITEQIKDINDNAVTGVKGNSETDYRKGDVNITKANIGLGSVFNLKQIALTGGTSISTNATDLNTLTTIGNYYCSSDSRAATLVNKPSGLSKAFTMQTNGCIGSSDTTYIGQWITQWTDGKRWYRRTADGGSTWVDWVEYAQNTNTWIALAGCNSTANGKAGYCPMPTAGQQNYLLRANGSWTSPTTVRSILGLGTSGTLPIKVDQGGTGLTASPSIRVNLGATTTATVMAASPRPGVQGVLGWTNGGTTATTRLLAAKALTNENVGSAATNFVGLTDSWGKFGYISNANAKIALALNHLVSSLSQNLNFFTIVNQNLDTWGNSNLTGYYVLECQEDNYSDAKAHKYPVNGTNRWFAFGFENSNHNYGFQLMLGYGGVYFRKKTNSSGTTWGAWSTILSTQ